MKAMGGWLGCVGLGWVRSGWVELGWVGEGEGVPALVEGKGFSYGASSLIISPLTI